MSKGDSAGVIACNNAIAIAGVDFGSAINTPDGDVVGGFGVGWDVDWCVELGEIGCEGYFGVYVWVMEFSVATLVFDDFPVVLAVVDAGCGVGVEVDHVSVVLCSFSNFVDGVVLDDVKRGCHG